MDVNVFIITVIAALALILPLVALLLYIKAKLTPSGNVIIDINNGSKEISVPQGNSLLATLANEKIFLPSACGAKGTCGECKCRVLEGGGTILPTEVGFFTRKQILNNWRLGCQVKVKDNLKIIVPESTLSVKKWERCV